MENSVSVIIPTLNASEYLSVQLDMLTKQSVVPNEILIIDSGSTDSTKSIALSYENVQFIAIDKADFDHGGTRHMAIEKSKGDIICFLTQDSIPCDNNYLKNLTSVFKNEEIACVCGRQIAKSNAKSEEALSRIYNYPLTSFIRNKKDIVKLGIKTFFLSDACSAYRRSVYFDVGGFNNPILTNEDMLIASDFIYAGYSIAYNAKACVYHSHNFNLKQDYIRSFNIGVFLSIYQDRLGNSSADKEGIKYVKFVLWGLIKQLRFISCIRFIAHSIVRYIGSKHGRNYKNYSLEELIEKTGNYNYWKNLN